MQSKAKIYVFLSCLCLILASCGEVSETDIKAVQKKVVKTIEDATVHSDAAISFYIAKPESVRLFWKDDANNIFKSFDSLEAWLNRHDQRLVFAMNAGMYMEDNSPLGLFIHKGKTIRKLNKRSGKGNFYLKPNGVFYISKDGKAAIKTTESFSPKNVQFATQSGPMLLVNGKINAQFTEGSSNITVRNGVGLLPDGRVLFAISNTLINFYDFARFFREKGCKDALFLDGGISRMYLPEKGFNGKDGNFGVIVGVAEKL